ncbi:MAG: VOC family protein [Chloroflexi bacterium]|nr:VOC family protein [Chloroflexota bacterium]MCI0644096.1 VOC family protein [Chloroflexota bacterium]
MTTLSVSHLQTGHVGLNVTNLHRSQQFYHDVFGFETFQESADADRRYAFLGQGSRLVLTLWQQSEGQFATNRPGLHHLSFQVDTIEQVRAYEARLQQLNIPLFYDGIVPHGERAASGGLFFLDPDGIRLEIYTATGANEQPAPNSDAPTCGFF